MVISVPSLKPSDDLMVSPELSPTSGNVPSKKPRLISPPAKTNLFETASLSPFIVEVPYQLSKSPNLQASQVFGEWVYTTHAEDGFTLSKPEKQVFQPLTPVKMAQRPSRIKCKKLQDTLPGSLHDNYYKVISAPNSFVLKLENEVIKLEPDIKNKFLTQYQII